MPEIVRPFRLGSKGNGLMWFVAGISIASVILTICVSMIPPASIAANNHTAYVIYQVVATLVMVGIALVIYRNKKESWKKK